MSFNYLLKTRKKYVLRTNVSFDVDCTLMVLRARMFEDFNANYLDVCLRGFEKSRFIELLSFLDRKIKSFTATYSCLNRLAAILQRYVKFMH